MLHWLHDQAFPKSRIIGDNTVARYSVYTWEGDSPPTSFSSNMGPVALGSFCTCSTDETVWVSLEKPVRWKEMSSSELFGLFGGNTPPSELVVPNVKSSYIHNGRFKFFHHTDHEAGVQHSHWAEAVRDAGLFWHRLPGLHQRQPRDIIYSPFPQQADSDIMAGIKTLTLQSRASGRKWAPRYLGRWVTASVYRSETAAYRKQKSYIGISLSQQFSFLLRG
jgi:hypothetical protein